MSEPPPRDALTADHRADLDRAVRLLARSSLALRVADYAGQPVHRLIGVLPGPANRQLTRLLETAILQCLEIAIGSLDAAPAAPPARWLDKLMTGMTGGVGGFFGAAALPIELPVTTTLMLRSIAEIARHVGEDLKQVETGLACLEVFALGGQRAGRRSDLGYYATRAVLSRLTGEVAALAVHQRAVDVSSPMVGRLVGEVAARFGLAISERAAASAVPILGALGGAGVNMMFMDHFQQVAEGHFVVRRLERRYGVEVVRARFLAASRSLSEAS